MALVVGLDPSLTSTGIAALLDGRPVVLRSIGHGTLSARDYAHRSDRIVAQSRAVMQVLADLADIYRQPDLAVIEGPAYGACNASTHDGSGLWWGLYSTLRARRIPTAVIAPGTRAKWATGSGRAEKRDVLAAVRTWWPDQPVRNHDIADAAVLALMGAHHLGEPMPFVPKPRHQLGLEAVSWPSNPCAKPEPSQLGAPR